MSAHEVGGQAAGQAGSAAKKLGSKAVAKAVGKAGKYLKKILMKFLKQLILSIGKLLLSVIGPWGLIGVIAALIILALLQAIPFSDWKLGGNARSDAQKNADLKYEQKFKDAANATVAELRDIEADSSWKAQLIKSVRPSWGIPSALVRYELLVNNNQKIEFDDYDPNDLIKSFEPSYSYTTIKGDMERYKHVQVCTYTKTDDDEDDEDDDTSDDTSEETDNSEDEDEDTSEETETTTETVTSYSEVKRAEHDVLSKVSFDYGEMEIKSLKRYYPGGTLEVTDNWEYSSQSSSGNCTTTTYKQYEHTTVDDRYVPHLSIDGPEFQRILLDLGIKESDMKLIYEFISVADPDWNPSFYGGKPTQYRGEWLPGSAAVPDVVLRYEPIVRKYLELKGMAEHTPLILALIMQESGGRYLDIMQSSESLGLPPNTITDPEVSIQAGINHFASVYHKADGDIELTLQAYNFGGGYISYAKERGGHSKEVALAFSEMMAEKYGWKRYGDPLYVDHVMRYFNATDVAIKIVPGEQIFDVQEVLDIMSEFLGQPYVWGGKGPSEGFDCSGLMSYAFGQVGIDLSGNAHSQYDKTVPIDEKDAKPGDLVFWETYKKAPSHVGMYLGDGKFINSGSSLGVSIDKLSRWKNYKFLGFRRIVE